MNYMFALLAVLSLLTGFQGYLIDQTIDDLRSAERRIAILEELIE